MTNRNTNFEYKVSGSVVITSRVTLDPKNKLHAALLAALTRAPNQAGVLRGLALRGIEDIAEESGLDAKEAVLGEIEDLSLRLGTSPTLPKQEDSEVA